MVKQHMKTLDLFHIFTISHRHTPNKQKNIVTKSVSVVATKHNIQHAVSGN